MRSDCCRQCQCAPNAEGRLIDFASREDLPRSTRTVSWAVTLRCVEQACFSTSHGVYLQNTCEALFVPSPFGRVFLPTTRTATERVKVIENAKGAVSLILSCVIHDARMARR